MKRYLIIAVAVILALFILPNITLPALLLFTAVAFVLIVFKKRSKHNLFNRTLREIDAMSGEEFEHYVARLFKSLGYKAQVTKTSGDYGADVIATRFLRGKGEKIAIQCKRYRGKVGISAVQEVIGAKAYYNANKAYVVTNNYYTDAAKNLAYRSKVILWDRDTLQARLCKTSKFQDDEEDSEIEEWEW